uniref:heparan-alpha-glucosaminide N-acetyltransferase n=1 Tax=Acetatifactor sp. TaxID=1872090 RepID=UPI0040567633
MTKTEKKRYEYLDILRGITLISMILYHTMWDLVYIAKIKIDWYPSEGAYIWQQSICWTFILLSGFCWSFGRQKWKRAFLVFSGGMIITLVTSLVMPNQRVMFGVLTFLGSSMFVMIPLEKVLKKCPASMGAIISAVLFLLTKNINRGFFGIGELQWFELPKSWYDRGDVMTFLGFLDKDFHSTDYFSFFPWIFLFIAGYFLYRIITEHRLLGISGLMKLKNRPLAFIGRHSLLIYMLHQPVIYLIVIFFCR